MTIAVCYLSPEGVVLGADSTATHLGPHYYNFTQKVFEVGEEGTLGMLLWGLAGLGAISYRTLIARLADDLQKTPATSVADAMNRWIDLIWPEYLGSSDVARFLTLEALAPHNAAPGHAQSRTAEEENEYNQLNLNIGAGFCIGGYVLPDRIPAASWVWFNPALKDAAGKAAKPVATPFAPLTYRWFGVPNVIDRLLTGADSNLRNAIQTSPKWTGTPQELDALLDGHKFSHPVLPIRDAVDFVHACIYSTVKAMKFSAFPQICGGPPEIAVITSDRLFRWVRHKPWDAAISEGTCT